jgi:hypothetical protein
MPTYCHGSKCHMTVNSVPGFDKQDRGARQRALLNDNYITATFWAKVDCKNASLLVLYI